MEGYIVKFIGENTEFCRHLIYSVKLRGNKDLYKRKKTNNLVGLILSSASLNRA
jgi:hypothetical protein